MSTDHACDQSPSAGQRAAAHSSRSLPRWRAVALAALLVLTAYGLPAPAAEPEPVGAVASAPLELWNVSGVQTRVVDGKLAITPADGNWARAAALSRSQIPFWNTDGAQITLHVSAAVSRPGDLFDNLMCIGLVSNNAAKNLPAANDFVGVHITYNRAKRTYGVSCARKEAKGDPAIRGEGGNTVPYAKNARIEVHAGDEGFTLTLALDAQHFSATVPGAGELTYPLGLNEATWRTPFLFAETMNFNGGRCALQIDRATIVSVASKLDAITGLDLRPIANRGFRDDVADDQLGGWTDQGENDLRQLATGRAVFQNIPFTIIDPARNAGKAMVVLNAKSRSYLPKTVEPLPIGRKLDSLVFLHAAAWAGETDALAARYAVTYSDGSRVEIPIRVGAHLNDWWSLKQASDPDAALITQVASSKSNSGHVGLYAYRWRNPQPTKEVASLTLSSAEGDVVYGLIAVSAVGAGITPSVEQVLTSAFDKTLAEDPRRNPPDRAQIPDQIVLKSEKALAPNWLATPLEVLGGGFGAHAMELPGYADFVQSYGGISRFPHGNSLMFYFWPYKATEWNPVAAQLGGGGGYLTIPNWFMKYDCAPKAISHQETLATYKKLGLKLILTFNTHGMFDGKDFIYVRALPAGQQRKPSDDVFKTGTFSQENLAKIAKNNEALVDYIIANGYLDTIAYWEMDNERYNSPGAEYADMAAAHIRMLRAKVPNAKVILCFGDSAYSGYSPEPDKAGLAPWSRDLLRRLKEVGLEDSVDYFAPHLYPFIVDKADELTQNFLADWGVRNIYRSLDYYGAMLDAEGFGKSRFYVTEWGTQVDSLDEKDRYLNTTMAAGVASAKEMMAIYSHPRVDGACWHQFTHQSAFGRESKQVLKIYGVQSVYTGETGRVVTTPPAEAVKLFQRFANGTTLVKTALDLPHGVHALSARKADGTLWHYVVNSTASPYAFSAQGVTQRTTLSATAVTAVSILRYGGYGDTPGEIDEILPKEFADTVLPPFSVSLVQ